MTFAERYTNTFATLGCPLDTIHQIEDAALDVLGLEGLTMPNSLREFYRIAGNESNLNHVHNRLLSPDELYIDSGRIVFMEENQAVVVWAVRPDGTDNPQVEQGVTSEGEIVEWWPEDTDCAGFLETMIYFQASVGGGLDCCGQAVVQPDVLSTLDTNFRKVGNIAEMAAYGRQGCAIVVFVSSEGESTLCGGFVNDDLKATVITELGLHSTWHDGKPG